MVYACMFAQDQANLKQTGKYLRCGFLLQSNPNFPAKKKSEATEDSEVIKRSSSIWNIIAHLGRIDPRSVYSAMAACDKIHFFVIGDAFVDILAAVDRLPRWGPAQDLLISFGPCTFVMWAYLTFFVGHICLD